MNYEEVALDIAKTLNSFGCEKVELIDLTSKNTYAKYIIICSSPNVESSKDFGVALESYMIEKYDSKPYGREGFFIGNWIIYDYENFVIHIMLESQREKYKIEALYKDGKKVAF